MLSVSPALEVTYSSSSPQAIDEWIGRLRDEWPEGFHSQGTALDHRRDLSVISTHLPQAAVASCPIFIPGE